MAIVRFPRKTDTEGKCTRWRVAVFNKATHRHEWFMVRGTKAVALELERDLKTRLSKGTYVAKSERMTVQEIADSFLKECRARSRRTSTLLNYTSVLDNYILPKFGTWEAGTVRKQDVRKWLSEMLASGKSIELVNRVVRVLKTLLFHAVVDLEVIERNVLLRFKQYERAESSPGRPGEPGSVHGGGSAEAAGCSGSS